ncbi:CDP-glycerol glycerophosphotransferase family protein [Actinobacillus pleuropneumoniae]|uniref:Capsular polysaccharide biosynthesis protein CpsD n=3 Tax=Gammaproteobacteria TaxID=1236 RepID=A0A059WIQ9_ACTPL|nr:CDP-glycerol glycerophosphotransferase family protein [Actinobacillus pleuropneumoniae]AIA09391.1 capsular polysaccharide biosynthesis protein CpsD [Actinobacillus pleuropneumoniae serovar 8 str. 405]QXP23619.1 CDP-glycerol glycerophosphotransferase family protein [Actinobacillus pleuropneumoniae serovar 8 str. 405]UKH37622.1 glycosyltransferase [Actinobacillus pleuropneumoniae serovar 8 str. 405]CUU53003.1 teichoic acid biosynthesis protein [Actinobacillus pleuropneumoniae serovar 8]
MKFLKNSYHNVIAPKGYHRGLVLYRKKQWTEALSCFEAAYSTSPLHAKNTFKLGLCHLKLGNFSEAHSFIAKALEIAPYNTHWRKQLQQAERHFNNTYSSPHKITTVVTRMKQSGISQSIGTAIRKTVLLIPSDYNHRVMADISSFIQYYKDKFDVYIILRELPEDIVYKNTHVLVKNGTSFGEYLKFTADYVIDSGTMNYSYRITDTNKWVSVWHGIPYKKMFVDFDIKNLATAIRYDLAYDSMVSMSNFYTDTFLRKAMRYDGEILQLGCAKIDNLFSSISTSNADKVNALRNELGLPNNKKVILYAPEFREVGELYFPFDPNKLLSHLGEEYCLLTLLPFKGYIEQAENNIYYISDLDNKDALLIADLLISDYHELIYTFDRYNKPAVLIQYDYESFVKQHTSRKQELEILASRKYVAKEANELYQFNWNLLKRYSKQSTLPEYLDSSYIKHKLGIPFDKKIVLYAPTFRKAGAVQLPFDPNTLLNYLDNDYVLITKMHYLNYLANTYNGVIDCTSHENMAELMKIADILISDYSSLVLDFAVLNKPIILFQYDYDEYMKQRGVYFNFGDYLPKEQIIRTEFELYTLNWNKLNSDNSKIINEFYPLEDGKSTQRIVDKINFNADLRFSKDIIFLVNDLNQIGGVHSFLKNMAKYYKQKYNSRIYVIAIKEFAEANSEYHLLESEYIDFKLSSQYLNGACANILQNTDGIVISLQFSAHMYFQKYLTNAKSVLMFHGDVKDMISRELYGPHLDWLNKGKLYNYQKLLLLTQSALDLLKPHLNPEIQDKLGFMHNSIDEEFSPIKQNKKHQLNTAVISRLDADKNIFAMIDLGKEILAQNSNVVVNIYGDGALKDEFIAEITRHGLEHILKVRGFESNKSKIFSENNSLLLMSKSEGFPLVLLEAYAYGKPVIVFDSFTAAKEIVKHNQSGFLLPYGDYGNVVKAIENSKNIKLKDIEMIFNNFSNPTVFAKWDSLILALEQTA